MISPRATSSERSLTAYSLAKRLLRFVTLMAGGDVGWCSIISCFRPKSLGLLNLATVYGMADLSTSGTRGYWTFSFGGNAASSKIAAAFRHEGYPPTRRVGVDPSGWGRPVGLG